MSLLAAHVAAVSQDACDLELENKRLRRALEEQAIRESSSCQIALSHSLEHPGFFRQHVFSLELYIFFQEYMYCTVPQARYVVQHGAP